ncbi:MAG: hypothetical protein AAFY22_01435 [Pseudomonadota bacterium]
MIILLQIIALGVFILIGMQLFNAGRGNGRLAHEPRKSLPSSTSPAGEAAAALRDLENVRADLRARYPAVFAMLGGYLNDHTVREDGSVEAAVEEMIADWRGRSEEVAREIVKILSENPDEEEVRAIVMAACDVTFEEEGYRNWMTWLLSRFNDV